MALRLTTPARSGLAAAAAPATSLAARGEALLRSRDVAGWRALLAGTAGIEDRHRRWQARRALVEAGLAARPDGAAAIADVLCAVAEEAVALLEAEPREPLLVNLAGVALYEVGAVAPAESLFGAALRLDPELPHVARNLEECRRRRKAGLAKPAGLPAAILGRLRELEPRAKRVAARARPAEGLTLSLCMIVKDEEAMLPRCLAAVRDAVDEIVIVDTGSADRTVEIAESFGARVLHHEWTGDFAAARNVSFDAATGDWIVYLDADEVLVEADVDELRACTGRTWREAMYLVETNYTGDLDDGTAVTHNALRVFRNRPEYRFEGRIHEQIAHCLPGYLPERLEVVPVRVEHFGYLGAVRDAKDKSQRNIELLERQAAEGVDTPFLAFNLGSEYAAAGQPQRALEQFRKGWAGVRHDPDIRTYGFVPSLAARLVKATRACGHYEEALRVGDDVLSVFGDFTDVVLEQAVAAGALGRGDEAIAKLERCLELGDASSKLSATVGCGTFLALGALADVHRARGEHDEAERVLHRCLTEHPRFLGAVDPYAGALLRRGVPAGEVVATLHALADDTPSMRFLLAVALYEAGAAAEAAAELRAVLAAQPGAHPARVALAEALLSQGRLAEAAAEAALVPADAPVAEAAARTAAFCALADRNNGVRPQCCGLPVAERALFDAWAGGDAAEGSLSASVAPLAATMLDALARLERFEAFEALAGAVDAIALPWRERRELLAGVYLRRGFLDSAADEWLTVCERGGPDARALAGLAAVARGRGLDEDAELLAREAGALAAAAP